jgi:hypothetical protein
MCAIRRLPSCFRAAGGRFCWGATGCTVLRWRRGAGVLPQPQIFHHGLRLWGNKLPAMVTKIRTTVHTARLSASKTRISGLPGNGPELRKIMPGAQNRTRPI